LDVREQEWICSEINAAIAARKGKAPTLEDMASLDPPEVFQDGDLGVTAGNQVSS